MNRCVNNNNNNKDKNDNIINIEKDDNNPKDIKHIIYVAFIIPEKARARHILLCLGWFFYEESLIKGSKSSL